MREISYHIQRILFLIGGIFILFTGRIFYLSILKHEYHLSLAAKPALRSIIKTPNRGTIRDRFNTPLAINTISYTLSILYDPIKSLPQRAYSYENGQKKISFPRKEAITKLSAYVEKFCDKEAQAIEDLIYSKASLFPSTPFDLAKEISEELFYQLKQKESTFPGLHMRICKKRTYPQGKVASHLLGYMGAIDEKEHLKIKNSMQTLKQYLDDQSNDQITPLPKGYHSIKECKQALKALTEKSYTLHSYVGKSGIEKIFDNELKGSIGKDFFLVDHKGNKRCSLPESYEETPGRRILLTISSKLQDHCEKLLADSEKIRSDDFHRAGKDHHQIPPPWIKGGSIVAMIPSTGEIVAMASYPTFDPNDFSSENKDNALQWLETPSHIAKIFDGEKSLFKETYNINTDTWVQETQEVDFNFFVSSIVSKNSGVKKALEKVKTIHGANFIQNCIETLLSLSKQNSIHSLIDALYSHPLSHTPTFHRTGKEKIDEVLSTIEANTSLLGEIHREIDPYFSLIKKNDDKILFLDILRLFCPNHLFDDTLLAETGDESLSTYKEFGNAKISVEKEVSHITKKIFHTTEFKEWKSTYFKEFLASKRLEEQKNKTPAKPYITYLEEIEKTLYHQFFEINKWEFISAYLTVGAPIHPKDLRIPYFQALIEKGLENKNPSYIKLRDHLKLLSESQIIPYIKTMRSFDELHRPLYGKYYFPFKSGNTLTEKDLARSFYPGKGFGFSKSHAFAENTPLGSSFKVFVGYQALMEYYASLQNPSFPLNPMTIIDNSPPYSAKLTKNSVLGYDLNYNPITRMYKGGRLPRGHQNIGKVNFSEAMEKSSNLYYALLASNVIKDPNHLIATAKTLGFGSKTGVDLPYESCGSIPTDILTNKTSLYSFAIGQHSLIVTPLQTAVALSAIVNNGKVLKPQIVKAIANIESEKDPIKLLFTKPSHYEKQYENIGIFFPLFPQGEEATKIPYLQPFKKEVVRSFEIPDLVHKTLMMSLYKVVNSSKGTARPEVISSLLTNPYKRAVYKSVMKNMGGKTSTAEIAYKPTLDREQEATIVKNIWFTAISFEDTTIFSNADLVVVVQLRFGNHGKEAAPLAASVIHEWQKILEEEGLKR
jgi:cell division protein FtsI/penicillin-binding protein 2